MEKIVIELTKEVTFELMDKTFAPKDKTPFSKFIIRFPLCVFLTKEKVVQDIIKRNGGQFNPQFMIVAEEYTSQNASLHVEVGDDFMKLQLFDPANEKLFSFKMEGVLPLPNITHNTFTPHSNELNFCFILHNIVNHTVNYFNKPTTVKTKTRMRENTSQFKQNKNGKHKNRIYVNKTVYKIKDIEDKKLTSRDYNRVREAWKVRGHYRHYRNPDGSIKKKVWVDSYWKGDPEKASDKAREYKITDLK
ncbi:MAG: hypothetical protein ACOCQR_00025 [bacterium]